MKSIREALKSAACAAALLIAGAQMAEAMEITGTYHVECIRDGKVVWSDQIKNTVVTVGKNSMLDNFLAGSAFTQTGPYMGLISSTSYSAISSADTMSSHAGWLEAGSANAPTYSGNRPTCAWSSASAGAKALSAALTFNITGTGTIEGAFINLGSGATNVIGATTGTLFSAGLFTGGTRSVLNGDTVNVSYSVSV